MRPYAGPLLGGLPLHPLASHREPPEGQLMSFWAAFFVFTMLEISIGIFYGLLWAVYIVMCVWFRQQIREKYGLKKERDTYAWDCLAWSFCCACAAAQEAKQV